MPRIWLTTDTHFGHEKMVEYCGRPKDFATKIINNLCKEIKNDDVLIHLGDFCIGNDAYWHPWFHNNLPLPKKWLVRGNHDRKSDSWYITHRWDFVGTRIYLDAFGKRLAFSHIPIADDGSWDFNIHGHFHNSDHRSAEPELRALYTDKHLLLALEYTNYRPVLLDKFLANGRKVN